MLAIRLQRTGRKGHAQFRMIVQESRRTPTSGNLVAMLGQYNPHTKTATLDLEKADFYLKHGAQPSDRVARLLKREGVKLPKWVQIVPDKERKIRHPEKLRVNQPAKAEPEEEQVEQVSKDEDADAAAASTNDVADAEPVPNDSAETAEVEAESTGQDAAEEKPAA